ncbi:MAG TPA: aconitase family protein [Burkholderiales bacterium]|nr:aconitase family protein [Burkholderiales bacterium]
MGQTITEKILARASGKARVKPGDYLTVTSNCPIVFGHHSFDTFMDRGLHMIPQLGVKVFDPSKVIIVDGHGGASSGSNIADVRWAAQKWARQVGIPLENVINLGRGGIENMMSAERAWARPGETFFQGCNGHLSTVGALGAFACALSHGAGAYLMKGTTWVRVPVSVKIVLTGKMPGKGVYARDVFEYVLREIGPMGGLGGVLEWCGPVVDAMSMDERFSLSSSAIFTGAWTSLMNPDDRTIAYVKAATDEPFEAVRSDVNAQYAKVYEFDVSKIEPLVVPPPKRHIVKTVRELAGTKLNRGFIGSDSGGWFEHMQLAAKILKGRKLPPDMILNITPGTVGILLRMLETDMLRTFVEAGVCVPDPNEGQEAGLNTLLCAGEVCIASAQTNYPGRMGSREADIYLANSATVAASCLEGCITDPRKYL